MFQDSDVWLDLKKNKLRKCLDNHFDGRIFRQRLFATLLH